MTTRSLVDGTANFRDVAASPGVGSKRLKPGVFFRSDALVAVSARGLKQMGRLEVGTIIDLRSDPEVSAAPDVIPDDVRSVGIPLLQGRQDAPGGIDLLKLPALAQLYASLLEDNADDLVRVIGVVAEASGPTLVHCAAGKDRTGVVSALSLAAVGADRESIVADYAITESRLSGVWEQEQLRRLEAHGIPVSDALRELMVGSPPEAMDATLGVLEDRFGGAQQYLLDAGLGADRLEALRAKLLT
ncbi:tyrosine-protein phosphatase [Galactobacter sp.]|uniref:tyrosine-protein phosphatase n=1 Tax=Galactobacter sp. TaxID=2676125 RepID=UPI0025C09AFB|nr:tyrosine-protein phosphatase [Galactobacter sp.]